MAQTHSRITHNAAVAETRVSLGPVAVTAQPASIVVQGGTSSLATLAHEIRGPLSAVALSSELLMDDVDQLDAEQVRILARRIHRGTIWLQGLIENMLCDAAMREGQLRLAPESTDLVSLYREVEQLLEPLIRGRGQELRLVLRSPAPNVSVDRRRISQVLVNLLMNASKFSPTDSVIMVTIQLHGGSVRVAVSDRGVGLCEASVALFERFHRSENVLQAGIAGTGLGLSIVKGIVDAHGGTVGASNRRGGGARFWFQVPADVEHTHVEGVSA